MSSSKNSFPLIFDNPAVVGRLLENSREALELLTKSYIAIEIGIEQNALPANGLLGDLVKRQCLLLEKIMGYPIENIKGVRK